MNPIEELRQDAIRTGTMDLDLLAAHLADEGAR